jgi:hypothetical protein
MAKIFGVEIMPAIELKLFSPKTATTSLPRGFSLRSYWLKTTTTAQRQLLALLLVFLLGLVISGV